MVNYLIANHRKGKTMYCTNCGVCLEDDVSFCPNCGQKVKREEYRTENIMDKLNEGYNSLLTRPKSRLIAGILAIVLGSIGAHDFYLGYTKKGIAHLVMYVFFLGWFSGVWALIEALYIFTGRIDTDADGNPLTDGF